MGRESVISRSRDVAIKIFCMLVSSKIRELAVMFALHSFVSLAKLARPMIAQMTPAMVLPVQQTTEAEIVMVNPVPYKALTSCVMCAVSSYPVELVDQKCASRNTQPTTAGTLCPKAHSGVFSARSHFHHAQVVTCPGRETIPMTFVQLVCT